VHVLSETEMETKKGSGDGKTSGALVLFNKWLSYRFKETKRSVNSLIIISRALRTKCCRFVMS